MYCTCIVSKGLVQVQVTSHQQHESWKGDRVRGEIAEPLDCLRIWSRHPVPEAAHSPVLMDDPFRNTDEVHFTEDQESRSKIPD